MLSYLLYYLGAGKASCLIKGPRLCYQLSFIYVVYYKHLHDAHEELDNPTNTGQYFIAMFSACSDAKKRSRSGHSRINFSLEC